MADSFARLTLGHIGRQYPYKLDLVMAGPEDALPPIAHHPIFHGSFDWHSCVHGWWQLFQIARRFPDLAIVGEIDARADAMFTPQTVAGELAFLKRPSAKGFERPYGWGWLLALHSELALHDRPWAAALEPLARAFADRFHEFLPKLTYPLRVGTHFNIAFALILALEWARTHDAPLAELIATRALDWFSNDHDCQAWEPGGDEFLSPALCEALLMSRLLPAERFVVWLDAFLPRLSHGEPATLFTPAHVSDRGDGKIAHLDGLNLSRAWCWRGLGRRLSSDHPVALLAESAALRHLDASLGHVAGDYMGEHWLATFALLALTA